MKKYNIAFCSGSSSKALGSYPGLSFVVGKICEFEKLKNLPIKSTYLNLDKFYHFIINHSQTPNTPSVPLFFALEQTLTNILEQGVANHFAEIKRRADKLRRGMVAMGLKFLIDQENMCSVLTTVMVPSYIDVAMLRQQLREKSIIIYEGKGRFKNKVFQVGNIGELSYADIQFFLQSLQCILENSANTVTMRGAAEYNIEPTSPISPEGVVIPVLASAVAGNIGE